MKIVILTTKTPHHIFFVREVAKHYPISGVAIEEVSLKPSFNNFHPFEDERDKYENSQLLKENKCAFEDFSRTLIFNNINDNNSFHFIKNINPNIVITYGTGKINKSLINLCKDGFVNLHGGDPQYYRGLDSHLWAMYHNDFSQLIVTLHRLNPVLDDGDIIIQDSLKITKESNLYSLRYQTAKVCVELCLSAIKKYKAQKRFDSKPQKKKGRYYSFMPYELKEIALNNFNRHIKKL